MNDIKTHNMIEIGSADHDHSEDTDNATEKRRRKKIKQYRNNY